MRADLFHTAPLAVMVAVLAPSTRHRALAAVALASTTFAVAAPAQAAETPADRAVSAGSTWLKGQLTAGILHNDEYDYDDLGLSADIAFALDAVLVAAPALLGARAGRPDVASTIA